MKIGFDVSQTGRLKAGCGYFADCLIRSLSEIDAQNQYILYPTFGDNYWDPEWSTGTCQLSYPNFQRASGHRTFAAARLFWQEPSLDLEKKLGNPDIIHSNNFFCPRGLKKAKLVYTLYDLSFLVHPEWTTEENRTGCFRGVFLASVYADLIIAISHFSRKHFLEIFPHYPEDRIVVVYPASRFSTSSVTKRPDKVFHLQPEQFWLNVGSLEPRKNHRKLLQAFALLKTSGNNKFPLVLAGGRGWLMDDFEKELGSLNLKDEVITLGYVDDEVLQWLYKNCYAFIYPSLFEGFGLPVLEAMSLGAPIIASRVSSIPEIVGDAGILFEPSQEGDIYRAMANLIQNPELRNVLKEKGVLQAARFSWKISAQRVLNLYREVIEKEPIFSNILSKQRANAK